MTLLENSILFESFIVHINYKQGEYVRLRSGMLICMFIYLTIMYIFSVYSVNWNKHISLSKEEKVYQNDLVLIGNLIDNLRWGWLVWWGSLFCCIDIKLTQVVSICSGFSRYIICNNNDRYYQIIKSNENQNATCSNVFSWFPSKYCIIAMSTSESSYAFHSTCVCTQRVIIKLVKATACEWPKMSYYSF